MRFEHRRELAVGSAKERERGAIGAEAKVCSTRVNQPLAASPRLPRHKHREPWASAQRLIERSFAERTATIFVLLLALLTGCGAEQVHESYGKVRGLEQSASVNGVSVLAKMFELSGSRVTTWRKLSPRLNEFDTIVWAPDSFEPPSEEERQFLEDWLIDQDGRCLIYIGRDFDAAAQYWENALDLAPIDLAEEFLRRRAQSLARHDARRSNMPEEEHTPWFTVRREGQKQKIDHVSGPWAKGVDADELEIYVEGRLVPPQQAGKGASEEKPWHAKTLLDSEAGPLVFRMRPWPEAHSSLIVVNNGSFLLNAALVNQEHRKLAGTLIDECAAENVVFLESGPGALRIFEHEPTSKFPSGLEMFSVWPLGVILLHLMALGVILLAVGFPIFGRPAELPPSDTADFGRHLSALGELLERTGNVAYAKNRVDEYERHVKRESGASHAGGASARKKQGRLRIEIHLPGLAKASPEDLVHRDKLERLLIRRRLGAVIKRFASPGQMGLVLVVADLDDAARKIEVILREVGMDSVAQVHPETP